MSDEKKKNESEREEDFGLIAPSDHLRDEAENADRPSAMEVATPRPRARADESLKQLAWKGFEEQEDEVDPDPPVNFTKTGEEQEDGMDMTPMVDVTFLLLIFFMVTASFSLQRSIPQPPSKVNEPSPLTIPDEEEIEKDYVEVIIDQNDVYYVTTRFEDEVETPSETQMRAKIRNAMLDYNAERLVITAHVDSTHQRVITVWDAGIAAGLEKLR
ncbi:MAG: biopolymer transporter ExbD [Pirellulaceae bacterium]